jgi:hypothetical protein
VPQRDEGVGDPGQRFLGRVRGVRDRRLGNREVRAGQVTDELGETKIVAFTPRGSRLLGDRSHSPSRWSLIVVIGIDAA